MSWPWDLNKTWNTQVILTCLQRKTFESYIYIIENFKMNINIYDLSIINMGII